MRLPEKYVRHIWRNLYLRLSDLKTVGGDVLEVLSVGDLNTNEGADFLNARLRLNGNDLSGDVEIHSRASDWTKHRHTDNPRYDRVALHVVFDYDAEIDRAIPTLELRRFLNDDLHKIVAACIRDDAALSKNKLHCSPAAQAIDDRLKIEWIHQLANERFEQKAQRFEAMLDGDGYDSVVYRGMMRALGYSENTAPMERLSSLVKYSDLRQFAEKPFVERRRVLEAVFFSRSGLLDMQSKHNEETTAYINVLRERFNQTSFGQNETMKREEWNFFRLRPSNFPTVRLAGLAEILSKNLERGFLNNAMEIVEMSLPARRKIVLLENLFIADAYGYWETHYRFGDASNKPLKQLIGKTRAAEIVINTLLPALRMAAAQNELRLQKVMDIYAVYPKGLTSERSMAVAAELLGEEYRITSAAFEQGLLELKNNYCDTFRCLDCAVGKKLLT